MKISTEAVQVIQGEYRHGFWHEGLTDSEFDYMRPIFQSQFENKSYYYWPKGKSYIFNLVYGAFCISKEYFDEHIKEPTFIKLKKKDIRSNYKYNVNIKKSLPINDIKK